MKPTEFNRAVWLIIFESVVAAVMGFGVFWIYVLQHSNVFIE